MGNTSRARIVFAIITAVQTALATAIVNGAVTKHAVWAMILCTSIQAFMVSVRASQPITAAEAAKVPTLPPLPPLTMLCLLLVSCGPALPTPAQQAEIDADRAAQVECVAKFNTKAEIDACRDAVKAKRDGGAS